MVTETTEGTSWDRLARPWQVTPPGEWTTWDIEAGRGEGKTRAGAEATLAVAREASRLITDGLLAPQEARIAAIGPTMAFVREVMVDGASGLLRCSPPGFAPIYLTAQRKLVYPGGVEVCLFGADEPSRIRGLQFAWIWFDEYRGVKHAREALRNATSGLRLGSHPRRLIASTGDGKPRSVTSTP